MSNLGTLAISSKKLKITMDNKLVKWNTARLIYRQSHKLEFFKNFRSINKDLYDIYKHLMKYKDSNYNGTANINYNSELYDELIEHLDNMVEFQKLVESNNSTIDLSKEAKERFSNEHVRCTVSVDLVEIARLELLLEYAQPVGILFNNLVSLTDIYESSLDEDFANEVREVILNKGLDNFNIPNELLII